MPTQPLTPESAEKSRLPESETRNDTKEKLTTLLSARSALLNDSLAVLPSRDFIHQAQDGDTLSKTMEARAVQLNLRIEESEVRSWQSSLKALSYVMEDGKLFEQQVILEYRCTQTQRRIYSLRADAMILGKDRQGRDNASIIELKQWQHNIAGEGTDKGMIRINVNRREVEVPHPCRQALEYETKIHELFEKCGFPDDYLLTNPYAYLHNIRKRPSPEQMMALFGTMSRELRDCVQLYTGNYRRAFARSLQADVGFGGGEEGLQKLQDMSAKRLMN